MMTDDGRTYKQHRYEEIIEEQVTISYISNGGISLRDSDYLTPYDRKLVIKSIMNIKDQEREAMEKAMK